MDSVIRNVELEEFSGIVVYGAGTTGWQLITINFVGGYLCSDGELARIGCCNECVIFKPDRRGRDLGVVA